MSADLRAAFLFRTTNHHRNITDSPFLGSAVANRLKKYLDDLRTDDGETEHSFRKGCLITLSLLGVFYEQVAKHVGWKSLDMAIYSHWDSYSEFQMDEPSMGIFLVVSLDRLVPVSCRHCFNI